MQSLRTSDEAYRLRHPLKIRALSFRPEEDLKSASGLH